MITPIALDWIYFRIDDLNWIVKPSLLFIIQQETVSSYMASGNDGAIPVRWNKVVAVPDPDIHIPTIDSIGASEYVTDFAGYETVTSETPTSTTVAPRYHSPAKHLPMLVTQSAKVIPY